MFYREEKEKDIERYFKKKVEELGYVTFKIIGVGHGGIPDRLLGAEGKLYFVELKRPKGGIFSGLQKLVTKKLEKVKVKIYNLKTKKEIDNFLFKVKYVWN